MGIVVVVIAIVVIAIIRGTEKSQDIAFEDSSKQWIDDNTKTLEFFTSHCVSSMTLPEYHHKYCDLPEWGQMTNRIKTETGIPFVSGTMLGLAFAAQEGLVPKGIGEHCGIDTVRLGNESDLAIERMFMRWWDKELRLHGFPDDLIIIEPKDNDLYYHGLEKETQYKHSYLRYVKHIDDPTLYRGRYTWLVARGNFGPSTMSFNWIQSGPGEGGRWSNEHPDDRYDLIWEEEIMAEKKEEEKLGVIKRCPKCGGISFVVPATVTQNWVVDGRGERTRLKNSVVDVLSIANNDEDVWTCNSCGYAAKGAEFNVTKEIETTEEE